MPRLRLGTLAASRVPRLTVTSRRPGCNKVKPAALTLRASHFMPRSLLRLRHTHRNRYSLTAPLGSQRNTGRVDWLGHVNRIRSVDQAESLQRSNPEIDLWTIFGASTTATGLNVSMAPFNDIRVRKAMQMALDLETINDVYFKGYGDTTPHGQMGDAGIGYFIPFRVFHTI